MNYIKLDTEITVEGIVSAFRYTFPKNFQYDGERHDNWEFVFVESGSFLAKADDKKYIIRSGELICHKPMEYHNLNPYHSDATAIIFCFHCMDKKMEFFENKILSVDQHQRLYINDIVANAKSFFIQKEPLQISKDGYMQKSEQATPANAHFLKNSIELLILSLYNSKSTEIRERVNSYSLHLKRKHLTAQIKEYLQKNIGKAISLTDIATQFSYSVSTVKTVFKTETGESIIVYYNKLRLEAAKKLLKEKERSMGEISEILGFNDASHFSNFFKRSTGITPRQYYEKY